MPKKTTAWLLPISDNIQFCIGEHEAQAYVNDIAAQPVPLATEHCNNLVFWQDKILPVVELCKLVGDDSDSNNLIFKHIFIIAYQVKEHQPLEYMAFKLSSSPEKILIEDDNVENSINEIPDDYPENLKPFLLSLFNYNNKLTSVFDIAQISQA